jgi:hypothetical protein
MQYGICFLVEKISPAAQPADVAFNVLGVGIDNE